MTANYYCIYKFLRCCEDAALVREGDSFVSGENCPERKFFKAIHEYICVPDDFTDFVFHLSFELWLYFLLTGKEMKGYRMVFVSIC